MKRTIPTPAERAAAGVDPRLKPGSRAMVRALRGEPAAEAAEAAEKPARKVRKAREPKPAGAVESPRRRNRKA